METAHQPWIVLLAMGEDLSRVQGSLNDAIYCYMSWSSAFTPSATETMGYQVIELGPTMAAFRTAEVNSESQIHSNIYMSSLIIQLQFERLH